jgi:hypothetical protein
VAAREGKRGTALSPVRLAHTPRNRLFGCSWTWDDSAPPPLPMSAGTTPGFTYAVTSNKDVVAYDTNVSSAVQPTAKQSPGGVPCNPFLASGAHNLRASSG